VLNPEVISGFCFVSRTELHGASLDALLSAVETIGQQGQGNQLMQALLKEVGIGGNPEIVGQVIGTLLVAGGNDVGVTLDDFKAELSSSTDDKRKCLALYILGETGLRLGSRCPLKPQDFTKYFDAGSEKVHLAAAVALGRAGAGNVSAYLPRILSSMNSGKNYLLLHSVKEMLQHSTAEAEILEHSKQLWDNIMSAAHAEDNKAVGAECIGRLAIIDPSAYLPQLQVSNHGSCASFSAGIDSKQAYLNDPQPVIRGMVISALRYTFADTGVAYDVYLEPTILSMLTTMLNDQDLDNRRMALSTFNSAVRNKSSLVLPHLGDLLPLAFKETVIRPELVREVTMGPFKHKVDDGLELRKSAYETLYALMEAAFNRISVPALYDRVIAGIADEHDIKIVCCLMITKLLSLTPEESTRRLDELSASFRTVLSFKPKDNAVKQELEKIGEHNKAIVKVSLQVNKLLPTEASEARAWNDYWEFTKKELPTVVRFAEDELKEKDR